MAKYAYHVLHIGLGITILWMGILIWQSPALFGSFLQPAMLERISNIEAMMQVVAVFDIILGILLIVGFWSWLFASIAALHLLGIIIGIGGFSDIVARDFGLMLAAVSLAISRWPRKKLLGDQSKGKGSME